MSDKATLGSDLRFSLWAVLQPSCKLSFFDQNCCPSVNRLLVDTVVVGCSNFDQQAKLCLCAICPDFIPQSRRNNEQSLLFVPSPELISGPLARTRRLIITC